MYCICPVLCMSMQETEVLRRQQDNGETVRYRQQHTLHVKVTGRWQPSTQRSATPSGGIKLVCCITCHFRCSTKMFHVEKFGDVLQTTN